MDGPPWTGAEASLGDEASTNSANDGSEAASPAAFNHAAALVRSRIPAAVDPGSGQHGVLPYPQPAAPGTLYPLGQWQPQGAIMASGGSDVLLTEVKSVAVATVGNSTAPMETSAKEAMLQPPATPLEQPSSGSSNASPSTVAPSTLPTLQASGAHVPPGAHASVLGLASTQQAAGAGLVPSTGALNTSPNSPSPTAGSSAQQQQASHASAGASSSADLYFGGNQITVSGPAAMQSRIDVFPDGTVTTVHRPASSPTGLRLSPGSPSPVAAEPSLSQTTPTQATAPSWGLMETPLTHGPVALDGPGSEPPRAAWLHSLYVTASSHGAAMGQTPIPPHQQAGMEPMGGPTHVHVPLSEQQAAQGQAFKPPQQVHEENSSQHTAVPGAHAGQSTPGYGNTAGATAQGSAAAVPQHHTSPNPAAVQASLLMPTAPGAFSTPIPSAVPAPQRTPGTAATLHDTYSISPYSLGAMLTPAPGLQSSSWTPMQAQQSTTLQPSLHSAPPGIPGSPGLPQQPSRPVVAVPQPPPTSRGNRLTPSYQQQPQQQGHQAGPGGGSPLHYVSPPRVATPMFLFQPSPARQQAVPSPSPQHSPPPRMRPLSPDGVHAPPGTPTSVAYGGAGGAAGGFHVQGSAPSEGPTPGSVASTAELRAKYKKTKQLLQAYAAEIETLRERLVSEGRRAGVLGAQVSALQGQAGLAGDSVALLAATQAEKMVAVQKLQESRDLVESLQAQLAATQAQLRALEQQQAGMLGEFGAERQRREAQFAEERQQLEATNQELQAQRTAYLAAFHQDREQWEAAAAERWRRLKEDDEQQLLQLRGEYDKRLSAVVKERYAAVEHARKQAQALEQAAARIVMGEERAAGLDRLQGETSTQLAQAQASLAGAQAAAAEAQEELRQQATAHADQLEEVRREHRQQLDQALRQAQEEHNQQLASAVRKTRSEAQQQLLELQSAASQASQALGAEMEAQLEATRREVEGAVALLAERGSEVSSLRSALERVARERDEMGSKAKELQEALAKAQQRLAKQDKKHAKALERAAQHREQQVAALQAELEALRSSVPGRVEEALRSHVAQLAAKQAAAVAEAEDRCAQQLEQQRAVAEAAAEKAREEVEGVTKRLEEALREGAAKAEAVRRVEELEAEGKGLEGRLGVAERRAAEAVEEAEASRRQLEEAVGVARRQQAKVRAAMALLGQVGVAAEALKELSDGAEAAAAASATAAAGVVAPADQLGAGVPGAQPPAWAEGSGRALPPHLAALRKILSAAAGADRRRRGKGGGRRAKSRSRSRVRDGLQKGLGRALSEQGNLWEEEDSDLVWLGGGDQQRRGRKQHRVRPRRSKSAADGGYSSLDEGSLRSDNGEEGEEELRAWRRSRLGSGHAQRWKDQQLRSDRSCSSTEAHSSGTESSSCSEGSRKERERAKHARWRGAAAPEDARPSRMGGVAAMEALQWRALQLRRAAVEARRRAGLAAQQARRGEEVLLVLHGAAARAQLALAGSTRPPEQELAAELGAALASAAQQRQELARWAEKQRRADRRERRRQQHRRSYGQEGEADGVAEGAVGCTASSTSSDGEGHRGGLLPMHPRVGAPVGVGSYPLPGGAAAADVAAAAGSQLAAARGQALEAVQAAALLRGQLQRQQQEHAAQMDALQAAADTAAAQAMAAVQELQELRHREQQQREELRAARRQLRSFVQAVRQQLDDVRQQLTATDLPSLLKETLTAADKAMGVWTLREHDHIQASRRAVSALRHDAAECRQLLASLALAQQQAAGSLAVRAQGVGQAAARIQEEGRQQLAALQRSAAESELQLQRRCEALQERVRRLAEAEERLGAEVGVLQAMNEKAEKELSTLRDQLDDARALARAAERQRGEALASVAAQAAEAVAEAAVQRNAAQAAAVAAADHLLELTEDHKQQLAQLQATCEARLREASAANVAQQHAHAAAAREAEEQLAAAKTRGRDAEEELQGVREVLRHTSDQLVMTRAELGELQHRHGGCGERVSELQAQLESAKWRADSEGRRAEELQSLLRTAEARVEREEGRVRELQGQVEAAREREGRLRREVEEVRGQVAAARKEAVEAREELRRARGAGEAAREGREEAERQLLVAGVRLEELRLDCQALEQQLKASREAVRESERQLRQEQREGDRLRLALRERLAHARDTPSRALLGSQAPVTDGMARVLEGQGACQGAEGSGSGRGVTDGKGNGSRGLGAGGEHEGSVGAGAGVESVGAADAAGDWNRAEAAQRGAGAEGAAVEAKPAQGDAGGSAGHAERQGGEQAEVQALVEEIEVHCQLLPSVDAVLRELLAELPPALLPPPEAAGPEHVATAIATEHPHRQVPQQQQNTGRTPSAEAAAAVAHLAGAVEGALQLVAALEARLEVADGPGTGGHKLGRTGQGGSPEAFEGRGVGTAGSGDSSGGQEWRRDALARVAGQRGRLEASLQLVSAVRGRMATPQQRQQHQQRALQQEPSPHLISSQSPAAPPTLGPSLLAPAPISAQATASAAGSPDNHPSGPRRQASPSGGTPTATDRPVAFGSPTAPLEPPHPSTHDTPQAAGTDVQASAPAPVSIPSPAAHVHMGQEATSQLLPSPQPSPEPQPRSPLQLPLLALHALRGGLRGSGLSLQGQEPGAARKQGQQGQAGDGRVREAAGREAPQQPGRVHTVNELRHGDTLQHGEQRHEQQQAQEQGQQEQEQQRPPAGVTRGAPSEAWAVLHVHGVLQLGARGSSGRERPSAAAETEDAAGKPGSGKAVVQHPGGGHGALFRAWEERLASSRHVGAPVQAAAAAPAEHDAPHALRSEGGSGSPPASETLAQLRAAMHRQQQQQPSTAAATAAAPGPHAAPAVDPKLGDATPAAAAADSSSPNVSFGGLQKPVPAPASASGRVGRYSPPPHLPLPSAELQHHQRQSASGGSSDAGSGSAPRAGLGSGAPVGRGRPQADLTRPPVGDGSSSSSSSGQLSGDGGSFHFHAAGAGRGVPARGLGAAGGLRAGAGWTRADGEGRRSVQLTSGSVGPGALGPGGAPARHAAGHGEVSRGLLVPGGEAPRGYAVLHLGRRSSSSGGR